MAGLNTYDCLHCGETFKAHSSSNAAANAYCSPQCESAAKEL